MPVNHAKEYLIFVHISVVFLHFLARDSNGRQYSNFENKCPKHGTGAPEDMLLTNLGDSLESDPSGFVLLLTYLLFILGDDGLIKIWDRRSLKESNPNPVGIFAGHIDGITFIDARDDARHIITNSKDQSIKLWDLRKFANNRSIELTKDAIRHRGWDYRWGSGPGKHGM